MSKKKKLAKLHKTIAGESLDVIRILEGLIVISEGCPIAFTLIEIAKEKTTRVFKTIRKSRQILKLKI